MSDDIQLENFYTRITSANDTTSDYENYNKLHIKLRKHICIVGSTGSGKTLLLLNLIKLINKFTRIFLFLKLEDEKLYEYFITSVRKKEKEIAKLIKEPNFKILYVNNNLDSLDREK